MVSMAGGVKVLHPGDKATQRREVLHYKGVQANAGQAYQTRHGPDAGLAPQRLRARVFNFFVFTVKNEKPLHARLAVFPVFRHEPFASQGQLFPSCGVVFLDVVLKSALIAIAEDATREHADKEPYDNGFNGRAHGVRI